MQKAFLINSEEKIIGSVTIHDSVTTIAFDERLFVMTCFSTHKGTPMVMFVETEPTIVAELDA